MTDGGRWLEQQIRRAHTLDLLLHTIPSLSHEHSSGRDWYRVLQDIGSHGATLRLFLGIDIESVLHTGPQAKAALHAITALTHLPNVHIYTLAPQAQQKAQAYLTMAADALAIRWPADRNPFVDVSDVEWSMRRQETAQVQATFDRLIGQETTTPWDIECCTTLLQRTHIIHVPQGTRQSWKDLLASYLPERMQEVEIYDRYIRNRYQCRSLELFLDALRDKASADGLSVKVTTACEEGERNDLMAFFKTTQDACASKGITLRYTLLEMTDAMPHFRRVQICADGKRCSLWLDRGLDIFHFENLYKPLFSTLETYIVIEQ
jgi:hypothetical protein